MTKILNFALKIKGVVGRVAHAKSSNNDHPPKFGTCTYNINLWSIKKVPFGFLGFLVLS